METIRSNRGRVQQPEYCGAIAHHCDIPAKIREIRRIPPIKVPQSRQNP